MLVIMIKWGIGDYNVITYPSSSLVKATNIR